MAYKGAVTPGTTIAIKDTSFKAIDGYTSVSGPGGTKPTSDITPMDQWQEKVFAGRPEYATMGIEVPLDPADAVQALALSHFNSDSQVIDDWQITLTDQGADALTFSGFIDSWALTFPNEGAVNLKFGVQATTAITHTPGGAASVTRTAISPIASQGTKLQYGSSPADIKGVSNIALDGGSRTKIDLTPIDATAKTSAAGVRKNAKLTFDLIYDSSDATHAAMLASFNALSQTEHFKVLCSDTTHFYKLDAVVDGWEHAINKDGAQIVKVSARGVGKIAIV